MTRVSRYVSHRDVRYLATPLAAPTAYIWQKLTCATKNSVTKFTQTSFSAGDLNFAGIIANVGQMVGGGGLSKCMYVSERACVVMRACVHASMCGQLRAPPLSFRRHAQRFPSWCRADAELTCSYPSSSPATTQQRWHAVTRGDTRWHAVTLGDTRWHSATLVDTQWHSETLGDTRWHSVTLDDTRWHSVTLGDTRWHSVTLGDDWWQLVALGDTWWHLMTLSDSGTNSMKLTKPPQW